VEDAHAQADSSPRPAGARNLFRFNARRFDTARLLERWKTPGFKRAKARAPLARGIHVLNLKLFELDQFSFSLASFRAQINQSQPQPL
jgi:hypothetical protein